jgi:hypothetical protein
MADWPPYSPDLNPLGFAICHVFQANGLAMPQANLDTLSPSIAVGWDWLAAKYILKTCCLFCRRQEAAVAKNGAFIEKVDRQPANTQQHTFQV